MKKAVAALLASALIFIAGFSVFAVEEPQTDGEPQSAIENISDLPETLGDKKPAEGSQQSDTDTEIFFGNIFSGSGALLFGSGSGGETPWSEDDRNTPEEANAFHDNSLGDNTPYYIGAVAVFAAAVLIATTALGRKKRTADAEK